MNARDRYINHTYSQSRDRGRAEYAAQDPQRHRTDGRGCARFDGSPTSAPAHNRRGPSFPTHGDCSGRFAFLIWPARYTLAAS